MYWCYIYTSLILCKLVTEFLIIRLLKKHDNNHHSSCWFCERVPGYIENLASLNFKYILKKILEYLYTCF